MIHVCSLARLHETVEETGARHVVTLLKHTDRVERPEQHRRRPTTSSSAWTTSPTPMDGYIIPARSMSAQLIDFVRGWDRAAPMVVHCYAGISRSTAGAFVAACALNPSRDETAIAQRAAPRLADRHAQPPHRVARRPHARPRRPHGRGHRGDRARRDGLRGEPVPARSGNSWPLKWRMQSCEGAYARSIASYRWS